MSWTKTTVSEAWPEQWLYVQGLLFIVVVGFFPAGLAGLGVMLKRRRQAGPPPEKTRDSDSDAEKVGASS